ncbi:hypothetical protein Hanom_Chr17g01562281 [Helianthus anomalus]
MDFDPFDLFRGYTLLIRIRPIYNEWVEITKRKRVRPELRGAYNFSSKIRREKFSSITVDYV